MKIENEAQYQEALKEMDNLLDATFTVKGSLEIEALTDAIEAYEAIHHPIAEPTFSLDDMIGFATYCAFCGYQGPQINAEALDHFLSK